MKIVIAPDSYKESLTALEVAEHIEAGFREVFPAAQYVKVPMADGGEGTVQAMIEATQGQRIAVTVTGPLGQPVPAFYGLTGDGHTAVIEMAAASGLALVPPTQRNPLLTTSYGTGELIRAALDKGARRFIIGLGGSATNDGGAGLAQALGARFTDLAGASIGPGGGALAQLAHIDFSTLDARLAQCQIDVACDVDNPLTGPQGASAIFGPQKGATPAMVAQLDQSLAHLGQLLAQVVGSGVADCPGAGAAGGMGAMLLALGGHLRPGVEIVTDAVALAAALQDADLVITGEGRMDSQTIHGKTPMGVAQVAQRQGIPVIGIAGCLSSDVAVVYPHGFAAVFSVMHAASTVEEALAQAAGNVRLAARNVAAALRVGQALRG
ncbi:glycerate kinase [Silvimonas terrae]|uniref:Glycerate kinase n=1 Tax=Silvimonas terrae TaxID=300266 RepID=A0A840RCG6_9NEIS|nr:glycerate kinase [Silvimonas terrae]MBB5191045.1 glycerate kinase [Silvimonas terrae]